MSFHLNNKIVLIILFTVFSQSITALHCFNGSLINNEEFIGFTIDPSLTYLSGEAREIVYVNGSNDTYLSELIWDLHNIFYIGTTSSINFKNSFYINVGVWTSINRGNGKMMDFDWIDGEVESNGYGREGWTRWSLSSVDIINSFVFNSNISYDFIPTRIWDISISLGYKYMFWDWDDLVLDSRYSGVDDYIDTGINAIDYQLALYIPYVGLGGTWRSKVGLSLMSNLIYSPLVTAKDHDHHISRGLHFYDNFYFGQYISGTLKSSYVFSDWFSLSLVLSGEYLFERRGSYTVYNESGVKTGYLLGGAGIQYQSFSISLNTAFSF